MTLNILCLIAQFYIALFPIGGEPSAADFFEAYLALPIILACFIFWKIYKKTRFVRAHDVDLLSGRRELNLRELKEQETREQLEWGRWKRYQFYFSILLIFRAYYWLC
jgi:yeast amino acid transporter